MDHVVSPEDVEPVEVVDLEVEEELVTCDHAGCEEEVADSKAECDDCHQEYCDEHIDVCLHCDDPICESCGNEYYGNSPYCSYCYANMTDCCVCGATINSDSDSTKYCESHDAYCCNSCYAGDDKCDDCYGNDGSESGTDAASGHSQVAPWVARGVHNAGDGYPEEQEPEFASAAAEQLWGVDSSLSLNQGAADFYLLEVVANNVNVGQIAEPMLVVLSEEAKAYRKNLVDTYDASFCGYADMAIGGELRYHRAVGNNNHLPRTRTEAWRYWKLLRYRGGAQLLLEAADLFDEINGGGVGGKRWADAARLLHSRVTGRITKEQWVDRVFTLQHNGGAFTNKIAWGPDRNETGQDITTILGPAHAGNPPDFRTLTKYASSEACCLFSDWWPIANKNRMRWRLTPWIHQVPIDEEFRRAAFGWFHAYVNAGWSTDTIRNQKLVEWDNNLQDNLRRFRAFMLIRHISATLAIHVPWHDLDKRTARMVVMHVLDHAMPKVTPQNMHTVFPAYLRWMCQLIANSPVHARRAFEYLYEQGVHIPLEYHAVAGVHPELEPF